MPELLRYNLSNSITDYKSVLRLEHIFAYAAERAYPIIGYIFEFSAGSNAMLGIAYFGVVNPVTYGAYILLIHIISFYRLIILTK